MDKMFINCNAFDQNLNNWDISKVTSMHKMFQNCTEYNQPMDLWGDKLNSNNVDCIFWGCKKFNQNISNWDVLDIKHDAMFVGCPIDKNNAPRL